MSLVLALLTMTAKVAAPEAQSRPQTTSIKRMATMAHVLGEQSRGCSIPQDNPHLLLKE
jgi:hypothetical protein